MSAVQPEPARGPDVPEGTEHCYACTGLEAATPQAVDNRHGLPAVPYRAGDWAQFRASLHAGLSDSTLPALNALLTRDGSDFSLALIDAFACSADVLSFYTERIAQESWLATATERVSLQEMGKLIGHRLRPGVAAEVALAFSVETPPVPPAAMAPEPGVFVHGVPDAVNIPLGFKVQSLPGQDEKPQVFETVEPLQAHAAWNAMRALPDADVAPRFGARSTWLAGTATQLRPGDMLLFVGPEFEADADSNRWDARVLTQVQADAAGHRTFVAWDEPLGSVVPPMDTASQPTIHALRDRAAIFGHNAPDWSGMTDEYKAAYLHKAVGELTDEDLEEWPHFDIYAAEGEGTRVNRFVGAADASQLLRESVRLALLQQTRDGAMAVSRLVASGASLARSAAAVPMAGAAAWAQVAKEVPDALNTLAESLLQPTREIAVNTSNRLDALRGEVERHAGDIDRLLRG